MKARYFTPENIQSKADEILQQIRGDRTARPVQPEQAALLVLDMQRYFLDPDSHAFIPSAAAVIPNIQKLITAFREHGQPVTFTQHLNTPENAAAMARWWRDLITVENPLSAITPELDTSGQRVFVKSQYDAFHETDLEEMLKAQGITQLIVTGVMTHLCCETTARTAFVRGFDVFFVVDGTATYNEDFHYASLLNLSHGFATILRTTEILDAF